MDLLDVVVLALVAISGGKEEEEDDHATCVVPREGEMKALRGLLARARGKRKTHRRRKGQLTLFLSRHVTKQEKHRDRVLDPCQCMLERKRGRKGKQNSLSSRISDSN